MVFGDCEHDEELCADDLPVPDTRLLTLADLPSGLPLDSPHSSPEERAEQIRRRRAGVDPRYRR